MPLSHQLPFISFIFQQFLFAYDNLVRLCVIQVELAALRVEGQETLSQLGHMAEAIYYETFHRNSAGNKTEGKIRENEKIEGFLSFFNDFSGFLALK